MLLMLFVALIVYLGVHSRLLVLVPSSPCPSLQSGDSGLEVRLGQVYGRSRRGVREDRMFGLE